MIQEGAIEGASAAFGMHVMPNVPSGSVALRRGTIMAGALSFEITVRGRGGHAALPHLNVDPVVAAAALVGALQTLASRETSPLGSAVLSVTMMKVRQGDLARRAEKLATPRCVAEQPEDMRLLSPPPLPAPTPRPAGG
jgi:metal-dependent amidase/aminoacylase/carboxypeptidase family protein